MTLAVCAAVLAGCSNLRNLAGIQKKSPDEFAVTTKAPLVIPPDFNLRPPMPGAPPANSVAPTATAEQTLFNNSDPQTVANGMRGNYSMAEKLLLANAGVQNSDPAIRARILGAGATPDTGQPVNADAVVNAKRAGAAPKAKKDSGGWFDWL
jgi:hypothetical protein